jgi:hypothetical protein
MNTDQIRNALQANPITSPSFRGVFAADTIQTLDPLPGSCVVNTDSSNEPGRHWIAVFQTSADIVEIFDSFGKDLSFYGIDFFKSQKVIRQTEQLQSASSTVCGQYCLFFLLRRAGCEKYTDIIHLFTQSKVSNDAMVCQYINHYFDLKTKVQDSDFLMQAAKSFMELK